MDKKSNLVLWALGGVTVVAIFFAGATWQLRSSAGRAAGGSATQAGPGVVTAAAQPETRPSPVTKPQAAETQPGEMDAAQQTGDDDSTGIIINGRPISPQQVRELQAQYGQVAPPGRYWYDTRSGMWGVEGGALMGFMRPGHDFGPLAANASRGNTGVFINGREINMAEAAFYQRLAGRVYQGHWWIDARGNVGLEENPSPMGNIYAAMQQAQQSAQHSGFWKKSVDGLVGASDGNCSIVSTDSGSWETPGCSQ